MKKPLLIAVVALSLAGLAFGLEGNSTEPPMIAETMTTSNLCPATMPALTAISTPGELGQLPWETKTSWWVIACVSLDGNSCPVVGDTKVCWAAPPFQVKNCVCQSNNIWSCS